MVDEPIPNRRQHDRHLDLKLEELREYIANELCEHVDEYHAFKKEDLQRMVKEHETLMIGADERTELLNRIIDALEGEEGEPNLHGEAGPRTGGMAGKINVIERDVEKLKYDGNGGRGFSVRNRDKIIIAALSGAAILAAEVVRQIWG